MGKCIEPVRPTPFEKINYKIFHLCMIFTNLYISKIKTIACHIATKSCVSEVKLNQIQYFKANSIFKKSFVVSTPKENS